MDEHKPLIPFLDPHGLQIVYQRIRKIIRESGMVMRDISDQTTIPPLTTSGAKCYRVDGSSTSLTRGTSCDKLPSAAGTGDIVFIVECVVHGDGTMSNLYTVTDGANLYTGSVELNAEGTATIIGEWKTLTTVEEYIVEVTQEEYDALTDEERMSGKIFFVTNAPESDSDNLTTLRCVEITEEAYTALPDDVKYNGTLYFISNADDVESGNGSGILFGVEMTQAAYDLLPEEKRMDGTLYFISDASDTYLHAPDIVDTMNPKGDIVSTNLPESGTLGDFYYLTDKYEGRYYNGTEWKRVV